jgi:hypothetical protein
LAQCPAVIRSMIYLPRGRLLGLFRSDERTVAEADLEIIVLRHQLAFLRRQVTRPVYRSSGRAILAGARRLLAKGAWRSVMVRPETLLVGTARLVTRKWTKSHRQPAPTGHRFRDRRSVPPQGQLQPRYLFGIHSASSIPAILCNRLQSPLQSVFPLAAPPIGEAGGLSHREVNSER